MRRTIAGCEFGICVDLHLENRDYKKLGENCLIDKDPLLLFSIHIKSMIPILVGVLVIVLVFIANICLVIAQGGLAVIGKKLAKISLSTLIRFLAKKGLESQIRRIFMSINSILALKLQHQIDSIRKFNSDAADLLTTFAGVFVRNDFSSVSKGIAGVFSESFKFGKKGGRVFELLFPFFFKLGIVLVLNLAAFMMNFNHNKKAIDDDKNKNKNNNFDLNQKAEYYQENNFDEKTIIDQNVKIIDSIYKPD